MKRDFELLRHILIQIEDAPASSQPIQFLSVDGSVTDETLGLHLKLLLDAGLIEGTVRQGRDVSFAIQRLTWAGHDFVERSRNEGVWRKVMEEVKSKGVSMTIEVLGKLLQKYAESHLGM